MTTTVTATLPAVRLAAQDDRVVVFCQAACRSAYDDPTCDPFEISVDLVALAPIARCWCCGAFLRPEILSQCEDCGRSVYYDEANGERYRHVELPEIGCFLISPEGDVTDGRWSHPQPGWWVYSERTEAGGLQVDIHSAGDGWAWCLSAWGNHSLGCDVHDGVARTLPQAMADSVAALREWDREPGGAVSEAALMDVLAKARDAMTPAPRYGWAETSATVLVRVNLTTREVDRLHFVASLGEVEPDFAGAEVNSEAPLTDADAATVREVANRSTWAPLQQLPPTIEWEG